ncbi:ankyrin repeat domain-containing protein [Novilysobacter arseniciresistens]|uniref:ankyrin repeat domain-containing protein n=1 Tax=Novilysobacter arseniciresistens TaxID=1385522 RepID=UPI0009DF82D2|nr:ankyrin repeat domain-containing protein [Lysobacter arseniciresistens]
MKNIQPQETIYEQLHKQLTDLGVHDAVDLADRIKLDIDPEAPPLHPLQLLHLAYVKAKEPIGGEDGFGDLTWRISCPRGLPHFTVEMERDNEPMRFAAKLPFTPESVERDFDVEGPEEDYSAMVWDYIEQQDDEDRASIWEGVAQDCNDYLECLHQADLIRANPNLHYLFFDAIAKGNEEAVLDGLDLGADPNFADDRDQTSLHIAARRGRASLIGALVNCGARVDEQCWGGLTPLHLAAKNSHADTCLALINHSADTSKLDKFGRSALHLARGLKREQQQDL